MVQGYLGLVVLAVVFSNYELRSKEEPDPPDLRAGRC
jgi:hypothetical protein